MNKWKLRAVELITGLAFTGKKNPSVIPYYPSKTKASGKEVRYFNRTSPERRGISSRLLYDMLCSLEEDKRANIHNVMVLKDGEVVCECSRPGYDVNVRHLSHSMSKTLTGMAIGLLVDDGRLSLDRRLVDIFPEYDPTDKRFNAITVKHLLIMSTGVPFSEAGSVTETEWTRAFFESRLSFAPGSAFAYNSMNSYILARIVVRIAGISLTAFLTERVFRPLGIENVFWEMGPEGVEKGGWGAYLSLESWAKLGVMMQQGGVFEGKRILSSAWVAESTSTQIQVPENAGDYNYGYQIWVHRRNGQFLFNGMLGQNVWVCPKNGIVVVANCENNELFQKSAVLEIIERYLGGKLAPVSYDTGTVGRLREKEKSFFDSRRWARPLKPRRGIIYKLGFRCARPFDKSWRRMLGTFTFAHNNHGILPLFIRAMQNNYSGGIESVTLEREGESLFFTSREGGVDYRFEVGLYDFKTTTLVFNGEPYIVRALGSAYEDSDKRAVYKIELVLPEMPNSRKLRFTFGEDGRMVMRMNEVPDEKIAEPLVQSIYATNPKFAFAVNILERRLGDKFINRKLESLFSPTLIGAHVGADNYYDIIADEKARAEEAIRGTKAISALILKAASDAHDD
ncbi:MAG: serine hydrolase [Clostridia bacterium]|nr:serine hydrolase [Clostridia bacterium]